MRVVAVRHPASLPGVITPDARFNVSPDGRRFRLSFVEPGPISYREMAGGTIELLRKNAIDAGCQALVGQPLTDGHPSGGTDAEIKAWARKNAIGTIETVSYDANDGWYWAEGALTKPEAVRLNAKPSVVFFARSMGAGGKFHGIPYGRELLAVDFDHIGLVPNPRFEGATFRFNSADQTSSTMNIKWLRNIVKKVTGADGTAAETVTKEEGEIPAAAKVDLGGGIVLPFSELVAAHEARMNAAAANQTVTLDPEAEITIAGKQVKVGEIIAAETAARLNAADTEKARKAKADADAETARLNAAAGTGFFVTLANARANAETDPFKDNQPAPGNAAAADRARVAKLFGPPGQAAAAAK